MRLDGADQAGLSRPVTKGSLFRPVTEGREAGYRDALGTSGPPVPVTCSPACGKKSLSFLDSRTVVGTPAFLFLDPLTFPMPPTPTPSILSKDSSTNSWTTAFSGRRNGQGPLISVSDPEVWKTNLLCLCYWHTLASLLPVPYWVPPPFPTSPSSPPVFHMGQQLAQQQGWGLHIHTQDLKSEQIREKR